MASSRELQKFYACKAWRDLRKVRIMETHGKCERCDGDFSDDTSELIGHHKVRLTDAQLSNPAVALNPDNIEVLCKDCHNAEHDNGFGQRSVYIVYGAPQAGKHQYVREHKRFGDLTVDMNAIWQAVCGLPAAHPDGCKSAVFAVRDILLDQIRTRAGQWRNAWVIGGFPRKDERERLAARLGATLIYAEADKAECLSRAVSEEERGFIDHWYEDYTA